VENRCDWLDNVDCSRVENSAKKDKSSDDDDEKEVETTKKPRKNSKLKTTQEKIETTTLPVEETLPEETSESDIKAAGKLVI
jgi:hypothetical protein